MFQESTLLKHHISYSRTALNLNLSYTLGVWDPFCAKPHVRRKRVIRPLLKSNQNSIRTYNQIMATRFHLTMFQTTLRDSNQPQFKSSF